MSKKLTQPRTFALNLREAMAAAGCTQQALCERMHVALATVSRWCRGLNEPDLETLRRVAEALGTTASELVRE